MPQAPRKASARAAPDGKATSAAAREIGEDATSPNTRRSEAVARRYWRAWYQLRYGNGSLPLPVPAGVVIQFIVDHGQRRSRDADNALKCELPRAVDNELVKLGVKKKAGELSLATILHRVAMIGRINRPHLKGRPNPAAAPEVRQLLADLRRAYAKRPATTATDQTTIGTQGPKEALTGEFMHRILAVLEPALRDRGDRWNYRRALRDRALLLFGFATGGRRRSEIASARIESLKRHRDGTYTYLMGPTKSTTGKEEYDDRTRPLKGRAAAAMTEWLAEARVRSGPIFRRIDRGGRIGDEGLSPESVRNLVVRLASKADLGAGFSAHSLRSGFMTEAFIHNIPLPEAMAFSGHRSVQSAARYYRAQDKRDSPAADLLD